MARTEVEYAVIDLIVLLLLLRLLCLMVIGSISISTGVSSTRSMGVQ